METKSIETNTVETQRYWSVTVVSVVWVSYQLFTVFRPDFLTLISQRAIHLFFGVLLAWLLFAVGKRSNKLIRIISSSLMVVLILFVTVYVINNGERFMMSPFGYTNLDVLIAILGIFLVLISTYRVMGLSLVVVTMLFVLYGLFGNFIPGAFGHRGVDVLTLSTQLMYEINGVFGQILGISHSLVFIYLLFGGCLIAFGGGDFFSKLAFGLVGKTRGGAAKVAILASAFFGSISGSSISNVVTTGTITIPLMKKLGFKKEFAGAVEAVASTGGQFLPPIMGAVAFIMADMLGLSYSEIVIAATFPAILYFVGLLFMVDFEAAKMNIKGLDESEIPKIKEVLKEGWHFFVPFIILLYLLIGLRWEAQTAAMYSIVALVIVYLIRNPRFRSLKAIIQAIEEGAKSAVIVTIPCAAVGIIVAVVLNTGLGLSFASFIRAYAGESLFLLLLIMMIGSLVMGMGVPTIAAYIMLAVMMVPALIELGIEPMAAHMFALYFGCLSLITPPVAMASYVAAGIAQSDPLKTSVKAFTLSLSGFIIPFIFVYQPELLLIGETLDIIEVIITSLIAIVGLSGVLQNYFIGKLNFLQRSILAVSCFSLILPDYNIVGITLFVVVVISQISKSKKLSVAKERGL